MRIIRCKLAIFAKQKLCAERYSVLQAPRRSHLKVAVGRGLT